MKRILLELKGYGFWIILVLLMAFVIVMTTLRIPVLTGRAVDEIVGVGLVDFDGVKVIIFQMVITIAITIVLQYLMNRINNYIAFRLTLELRLRAFDALSRLSLSRLDTISHGDYISRIITDADVFSDGLLLGFSQLFSGVMTILMTIVFMAQIHLPLTLVVVALTPFSVLVARFISKGSNKYFGQQAADRGQMTDFVDEHIGGQKLLRCFNQSQESIDAFEKINASLLESTLKATFFSSLPNPSSRLINNLVYMSVGVFGALAAIKGHITIGELSAFLAYATQYAKPFNEITGVVTEMQNALVCAGRIFSLIDEPEEIETGDGELGRIRGSLCMKDVSFSYDKTKPLMEHLNIVVKPGERVAIVGPTGAGKTTLINLLMRFYDPDSGSIFMDDNNIADIRRCDVRTHYGMVLQETWLSEGTIADNIRMGHPGASIADVLSAAEQTRAHEFIRKLPNKYDTFLSSDGGILSQGQKQLLCITRVMLSLPPMLILDEATSSIDTRTEMKIQSAFSKMMQGRTTFIVAHRLSTIRNCDKILYMEHGTVFESGTHDELMQLGGGYAKLYNSQWD